jgi:hypothetical protein
MQTVQRWRSNYLSFDLIGKRGAGLIEPGRNPLLEALMGAMLIVITSKSRDHTSELILVENEEVVKTFSAHYADQWFTMGIGFGSLHRCFQFLNTRAFGNGRELLAEFSVVIANELFWTFAPGCCFS